MLSTLAYTTIMTSIFLGLWAVTRILDGDGGELTKVFVTKTCHWKLTNSTTMTFATTIEQLKKDKFVWDEFTLGSHPNDFAAFLRLRELGRSLVTPLPGYSTHCEPQWASPLTDWSKV